MQNLRKVGKIVFLFLIPFVSVLNLGHDFPKFLLNSVCVENQSLQFLYVF